MTENFFDKYELYTDEESIYCYPDTIVLKNKFNIKYVFMKAKNMNVFSNIFRIVIFVVIIFYYQDL